LNNELVESKEKASNIGYKAESNLRGSLTQLAMY
jgi:hypothetical protein